MNAITETWSNLSIQRRALLIGAVVATLAFLLMFARIATQPTMALLYGGLDQQTSGEVVTALEGMNVPVDVRGESIYVPVERRDRVRMALAEQGLPQQGQAGYELLDQLSGFGTTSEMFQAAYWRAKEGELARTIASLPGVQAARVHIGADARRPFQRTGGKSTASVTVTMRSGQLTEQKAVSIRYLVALAVPNLDPTEVAVADADNGLVLRPGDERANLMMGLQGERRAERLRAEIEELIGRRVGAENVHVNVAVETTTESETISERLIDPESQVTLSTETEETIERSQGRTTAVTVASNLPDGDAANDAGQDTSELEQTSERTEFGHSVTQRNQVIEAGGVRRIGVAVLLNDVSVTDANGQTTWQPRSQEELDSIEELVKSAMAFDADRGDVVTIESMQFAQEPEVGTVVEASVVDRFVEDNFGALVQLGILAAVVLALGLFVVRPIFATRPQEETDELAAIEGALSEEALDGLPVDAAALPPGEAAETTLDDAMGGGGTILDTSAQEEKFAELGKTLSDLVLARPEEASTVIKKWLGDELDQPASKREAA